jgi:acetyl esterase/lipase
MRHCLLVTLIAIAAAVLPTRAQQSGDITLTYTDAMGWPRTIELWVPDDSSQSAPRPLLVTFHGAGMSASEMRDILRPSARALGAILAAPEYTGVSDDRRLDAMFDSTVAIAGAQWTVDRAHVVLAGFSWGGGIAWRMGLERPGIAAGIIGLAPAIDTAKMSAILWENIHRTRMAVILGDKDFYYREVRQVVTAIEGRGGSILYIEKPDVQHNDPAYFASQELVDDVVRSYEFVTAVVSGVETSVTPDIFTLTHNDDPPRDDRLSAAEALIRVGPGNE